MDINANEQSENALTIEQLDTVVGGTSIAGMIGAAVNALVKVITITAADQETVCNGTSCVTL